MRTTNSRRKVNREKDTLARAFMSFNMEKKPNSDLIDDFKLGKKVQEGTLSSVSEIIRAISIIKDLATAGVISKSMSQEILMNLAMKMSGCKVVKG